MPRKHRVLIVEDDPQALEHLKGACEALGHEVNTATSVDEAEARFRKNRYCYLLLDVMLPMREGLAPWPRAGVTFLRDLRKRLDWRQLPVVVITAFGTRHIIVAAFKAGANDFATKPFEEENEEPLDVKIRQALAFGCESRRSCPHLCGDEPGGKRVYESRHKLHFVGDVKKGRALLEVNGDPYWVQRNTFEMLFSLVHEDRVCADPEGWVHGTRLTAVPNHSHAVKRMLDDLAEAAKLDDLVHRDSGRVRLCTPPDCVTWDLQAMLHEHKGLVAKYCA